jgi:hypothetical protein
LLNEPALPISQIQAAQVSWGEAYARYAAASAECSATQKLVFRQSPQIGVDMGARVCYVQASLWVENPPSNHFLNK